jgi:hypothetical protein
VIILEDNFTLCASSPLFVYPSPNACPPSVNTGAALLASTARVVPVRPLCLFRLCPCAVTHQEYPVPWLFGGSTNSPRSHPTLLVHRTRSGSSTLNHVENQQDPQDPRNPQAQRSCTLQCSEANNVVAYCDSL